MDSSLIFTHTHARGQHAQGHPTELGDPGQKSWRAAPEVHKTHTRAKLQAVSITRFFLNVAATLWPLTVIRKCTPLRQGGDASYADKSTSQGTQEQLPATKQDASCAGKHLSWQSREAAKKELVRKWLARG
eukprot:1157441-Pelagomonas_calceolata.AAC.3